MPTTEAVARTDAGLAAELRVGVMRLRRRLALERHPDNDLSLGQMAVLALLLRRGELTIGELARLERVQPPSMTRTVSCLEELGHGGPEPARDRRSRRGRLAHRARPRGGPRRPPRRDAWLAVQLAHLTPDERDILRRAAPLLDRLSQAD